MDWRYDEWSPASDLRLGRSHYDRPYEAMTSLHRDAPRNLTKTHLNAGYRVNRGG